MDSSIYYTDLDGRMLITVGVIRAWPALHLGLQRVTLKSVTKKTEN